MDKMEKTGLLRATVPALIEVFDLSERRGNFAAMFSYDRETERIEARIVDEYTRETLYRALYYFDDLDLPARVFASSEAEIVVMYSQESETYQATLFDASGFLAFTTMGR